MAGEDRRAAATGLVVLMVVGSVTMWLVSPVAWLWIGSQVVRTQAPSLLGPAIVFGGVVATSFVLAAWLGDLNRRHQALRPRASRRHLPWQTSMRGGRDEAHEPSSVLATVMVLTIVGVGLLVAVWFAVLAGPPPGEFSR